MNDREALLNLVEKLSAQVRSQSERDRLNTLQMRKLTDLLAEVRKWMDGDTFGPWDADFIRRIDSALAATRQDYKSVAGQGDAQSRADQGDEPGTTGPAASRTAQETGADAAEKYVEELDYIDNEHRRIAGYGFLAGARWAQREKATQVCKHIPFIGAKGEPHCQLCGINLLSSNEDKQADHTGKPGCRCRECHAQRASSNECHAKRKSSNEGESK